MRLEILMSAAFFFGGSCLTGYALRRFLKLKQEGFLFSIVTGAMFWWALMEVILVPMTMALASFTGFTVLYTALLLVCMAAGCFCRKEILEDIRQAAASVRAYMTLGHLMALALIFWQLYFIHHHMYLEWDDTYYVNLANEAVQSDRIYWIYPETGSIVDFDKRYVLSLWPIFYAWMSKLTGVLPTVMAHTIFPWLIIPLAGMVYELIGRRLFPGDRQLQGMFLAMAALLHLFMSGEHTAGITFLSLTPWVGKGVLAGVLIPVLFYWILCTAEKEQRGLWVMLGITCLGGCLLSSMGIMLIPLFVGTAVCLVSIHKRSPGYLLRGAAACLPCVLLGIYYIYLSH
ncbi:MAG: hypothetical protein HFI16_03015 [Lachnospiraceae bacterium]|nr:hypothetical protein [Lachnospiraceae bacterium]